MTEGFHRETAEFSGISGLPELKVKGGVNWSVWGPESSKDITKGTFSLCTLECSVFGVLIAKALKNQERG